MIDVSVVGAHPGSADDGYRARKAGLGAFGDLTLKEIPFSLHVTTSQLWEHRQAHTEQDVLQTNPTVSNLMAPLAPGGGGMSRTMVRGGVMGDQGVLRDGLVDRSFTYPWFENVERVEVMTGLSSLLNGFGTLGGTINYVSKRPTLQPQGSLAFGVHGGGILFATGDVSGPLPLMRSNATLARSILHAEGGSTFVDRSLERRILLST
ncbi:MAG: TonB-dependent receptor plug domain-containing protein, partial [Polyangiales bacterium]